MKHTKPKEFKTLKKRIKTFAILGFFVAFFLLISISLSYPPIVEESKAASFVVDSLLDTSDANAGNSTCADGSGNCTLRAAIQEANALAGADTITFSVTGTINITNVLNIDDTSGSLTITGPGGTDIIIDGTNSGAYSCIYPSNAGVEFSITGLKVQNCNGPCIQLGAINGGTISNLTIDTCSSYCIRSNAAGENVTISNNTCTGATGVTSDGIGVQGSNLTISNNTTYSNGRGGIFLSDVDNSLITGNYSHSNAHAGLWTYGGSTSNTIQNNIFTDNTAGGVYIIHSDDLNNYIYNNTISGDTTSGIIIEAGTNTTADSNTIFSNTEYGINISTNSNTISNNFIYNNSKDGILINSADSNQLSSNTVYGHGTTLTNGFSMPRTVLSYEGTDYNEAIIYANDGGGTALSFDGEIITGNDAWDGASNISVCVANIGSLITLYSSDDSWNQISIEAALGGAPCVIWIDDIFTAGATATSDYTYNSAAVSASGATLYEAVGFNSSPTLPYYSGYLYSAITLTSSNSNTLTSNTIYTNGNGLTFTGTGTTNTVDEGTITGSLGYDLQHSSTGTNVLDNLSFDTSSTNVTAGQVNVSFDVRGYILDSFDNPLTSATAVLTNANAGSTSLGTTTSGYTSYSSINAFNLDSSGYETNNNDHAMAVAMTGYSDKTQSYTINSQNQTLTMNIHAARRAGSTTGGTSAPPVTTPDDDDDQDDSTSQDDSSNQNDSDDSTGQDKGVSQDSQDKDKEKETVKKVLTEKIENPLLIKFPDSKAVYLVDKDLKTLNPIFNHIIFEKREYDWTKVAEVTPDTYSSYSTGLMVCPAEGELIKDPSNPKVFIIEQNQKRWITDESTFYSLGYSFSNVSDITGTCFDDLPEGVDVVL